MRLVKKKKGKIVKEFIRPWLVTVGKKRIRIFLRLWIPVSFFRICIETGILKSYENRILNFVLLEYITSKTSTDLELKTNASLFHLTPAHLIALDISLNHYVAIFLISNFKI